MAVTTMIGAKIHRREDPRLVTGHGRYVDDMTRPGMLHMSVVRSPFAHARIRSIDPGPAKSAPGVVAVLTARDFKDHIAGGLPVSASFVAEKKQVPNQFPIATDEVVYQGEPVAVILAEERYQGSDAASLIDIDYEPLPAVMDVEKAMQESMMEIVPQLEKRTHYLATLANVATLLGLLGTVSGLIHAFAAGATVNPAEKANLLSASISEAMNCTAFGLVTAVPILVLHAFLQSTTMGLNDGLETAAIRFLNALAARQAARAQSRLELVQQAASAA